MSAARALSGVSASSRAVSARVLVPAIGRTARRNIPLENRSVTASALPFQGNTFVQAVEGFAVLAVVSRVGGGAVKGIATNAAAGILSTIRNTPGIAFLGQKKWGVLVIAVLIDAIGMTSYVLPGIGEAEDAAWAPISAILVQALYGNGIITTIDFLEEALPFSDAIPTATLGWVLEYTLLGKGVKDVTNVTGAGASKETK